MSLESQRKCTPESLQLLLKLILDGSENKDQAQDDMVVLGLSQLVYFNAAQRRRGKGQGKRHDREKECPLPVYIALKMYSEAKGKGIVDIMFRLGLCISYDRLRTILGDMKKRNLQHYQEAGVVCPPSLRHGIFTSGQIDNIDHDTSSTTAKSSFHGTAISLVQHPPPGIQMCPWQPMPTGGSNGSVNRLPRDYEVVQPCALNPKLAKFNSPGMTYKGGAGTDPLLKEADWLESVYNSLVRRSDGFDNWASHHGAKDSQTVREACISAVLPLFPEHAATPAMMLHGMNKTKEAINYLNPGQVPVLVCDQPLFALCASIQRLLPDTLGEEHIFVMMGGLHVEMCAQKVLGQWADGSGWTSLLTQASILTQGRAESALGGSHVTRTRYAHEVTVAVLYCLMKEAYDSDGDFLSFDQWREEKCQKIPQFSYWVTFFRLELIYFQFVHAQRTADLQSYVEMFSQLMPWFFAFDHTNYARWGAVHVRALLNLGSTHPTLFAEFMNGHFVGRNSCREFSAMALDQIHEQLNAKLKGKMGLKGRTEDPDGLLTCIVAGPDVVAVLDLFEQIFQSPTLLDSELHHHSDTEAARQHFWRDVKSLKAVFDDLGNPFTYDGDDLFNIETGQTVSKLDAEVILSMEGKGKEQYESFCTQRLQTGAVSLHDPIPQNRFPRMQSSGKQKKKGSSKVASLKNDCELFSMLYIANQHRQGDMKEFIKHENLPFPPSLASNGVMHTHGKSQIVSCLIDEVPHSVSVARPAVDATILDGAAVVNMLRPTATDKTFGDYVGTFATYIQREMEFVSRLDLVSDVYLPDSLKQATREKRGFGVRTVVSATKKLPKRWDIFMRESSNKDELFQLMAQTLVRRDWGDKVMIATHQSSCLSSASTGPGSDLSGVSPCNHEEADTRLMLHALHAARHGFPRVMVRSVDSDVVVLAVWTAHQVVELQELWVSYGRGAAHKFLAAHELARCLGPERSYLTPSLQIFGGCDNTSSFLGIGSVTLIEACKNYPDSWQGLRALSEGKLDEALAILEKLVVLMYSRKSSALSVNDCRLELFLAGRLLASIPPTQDALVQHLKRCIFMILVWQQALVPMQQLPSPADWGWKHTPEGWEPIWTTLPVASKACSELIKCGCKTGCTATRCSCRKRGLQCTNLCKKCKCSK